MSCIMGDAWKYQSTCHSDEEDIAAPPVWEAIGSAARPSPSPRSSPNRSSKFAIDGRDPFSCIPKWAGIVDSDDELTIPPKMETTAAPVPRKRNGPAAKAAAKAEGAPQAATANSTNANSLGAANSLDAATASVPPQPRSLHPTPATPANSSVPPRNYGSAPRTGFHSEKFKTACAEILQQNPSAAINESHIDEIIDEPQDFQGRKPPKGRDASAKMPAFLQAKRKWLLGRIQSGSASDGNDPQVPENTTTSEIVAKASKKRPSADALMAEAAPPGTRRKTLYQEFFAECMQLPNIKALDRKERVKKIAELWHEKKNAAQ